MTELAVGLWIAGAAIALPAGPRDPAARAGDHEPREALAIPIATIETALRRWDLTSLTNAAQDLAALETTTTDEAVLRDLWRATALFHVVLAVQDDSQAENPSHTPIRKHRDRISDQAVLALQRVLEQRPEESTSHIMLALLYGMQISRRPLAALTLGPRLSRHRRTARRTGAADPRVHYLQGAGLLRRADRDRDVAEAIAELLKAEALFAREAERPPRPGEPRWGRCHNAMFLGEAYEQSDNMDKALEWFQKAIRAAPELQRARKGYVRCKKKQANR